MKSIFEHDPKEGLVHQNVRKDLEKVHFDIERITLVKSKAGMNCDVIAKDNRGYRSYHVKLEKNAKFKNLYRIYDVKGQKIVSNYQWRDQ